MCRKLEPEQYFLQVVCVRVFEPLENGKPGQLTLSLSFCFHCLGQAYQLPQSPAQNSSVSVRLLENAIAQLQGEQRLFKITGKLSSAVLVQHNKGMCLRYLRRQ